LQSELKNTISDRDNLNLKLEAVMDSIGKTDLALLDKEIANEDERELGPLKYLAATTGWSMDKVVNWFLLLIVIVFDPLAIALVVAANFAFSQALKKEPEPLHLQEEQLNRLQTAEKKLDSVSSMFSNIKKKVSGTSTTNIYGQKTKN
jgi:hypothetical protein